jgi:hypothetical protein
MTIESAPAAAHSRGSALVVQAIYLSRSGEHVFTKLTQPHVAEVMLGHRLPGTWQTYDHYTYLKEQAAAYSAWWKRLTD